MKRKGVATVFAFISLLSLAKVSIDAPLRDTPPPMVLAQSSPSKDFPDAIVEFSTPWYHVQKGAKNLFFPLSAIEYVAQRYLMSYVYPAQTVRGKATLNQESKIKAALEKAKQLQANDPHFRVQEITLRKNGLKLNGWVIYDPDLRENQNWVLQAVGNSKAVEEFIPLIEKKYIDAGFNTLLVNNPGVSKSEGIATPKSIGETQAFALSYLEKLGAKKIALAGHSLGGAAIGQAILLHSFKPDLQYLVVQQMTFGRLSHVAGRMYPFFQYLTAPLFWLINLEMDTVAASEKLDALNIPEHILNKREGDIFAHDKVIPGEATLAHLLHKTKLAKKKVMDYFVPFDHNEKGYLEITADILRKW